MNQLTIFSNADSFELAQRQAKALAESTLIPVAFQKNIPNCLIALELANRLDLSPLIVFQSLYVVGGKPAFNSNFIIAQINASGKFDGPLQFSFVGEGDKLTCNAYAYMHNGEQQVGPRVSIEMAKKEGWYNRKGSKWQTLPDLMLRYRAAAFFGRVFTPELLLGMQTYEELRDIEEEHEARPRRRKTIKVTKKINEKMPADVEENAARLREIAAEKWPKKQPEQTPINGDFTVEKETEKQEQMAERDRPKDQPRQVAKLLPDEYKEFVKGMETNDKK